LGSNVHPALHPKFLIRGGSGEEVQETESETEELPETTERAGLLSPLHNVLVRYGAISGEDPEHRDLDVHAPRHLPDTDEGTPITRGRLHKILTEHADEVDEHAIEGGHSTKRGGQGRLNERQKSILFGEGSGLEEWDQSEDIIVYDEGDVLILTTEDGEWDLPAVVKGPRILRLVETSHRPCGYAPHCQTQGESEEQPSSSLIVNRFGMVIDPSSRCYHIVPPSRRINLGTVTSYMCGLR
jgi:hypothetical protein